MSEDTLDADTAEAESAAAEAESAKAVDVPAQDDWKTALPEDIRDNTNFAKYSSMESFAKGHLNAVSMLGKEVELKLPENDDERGEFYNKIGRPEAPEGYEFTPQPDDIPEDLAAYVESRITDYRDVAHKAGLTAEQASTLHDWFMDGNMDNSKKMAEQATLIQKKGFDALNTEWGEAYAGHLNAAKNALAEYGSEELVIYLEQTGLGDNPALIKAFANVGLGMKGESALVVGESGDTPTAIDGQIKEIMAKNEYWDADSPERPALVRKVSDLMKRMHPEGQA